jgi:hypothetical protein
MAAGIVNIQEKIIGGGLIRRLAAIEFAQQEWEP